MGLFDRISSFFNNDKNPDEQLNEVGLEFNWTWPVAQELPNFSQDPNQFSINQPQPNSLSSFELPDFSTDPNQFSVTPQPQQQVQSASSFLNNIQSAPTPFAQPQTTPEVISAADFLPQQQTTLPQTAPVAPASDFFIDNINQPNNQLANPTLPDFSSTETFDNTAFSVSQEQAIPTPVFTQQEQEVVWPFVSPENEQALEQSINEPLTWFNVNEPDQQISEDGETIIPINESESLWWSAAGIQVDSVFFDEPEERTEATSTPVTFDLRTTSERADDIINNAWLDRDSINLVSDEDIIRLNDPTSEAWAKELSRSIWDTFLSIARAWRNVDIPILTNEYSRIVNNAVSNGLSYDEYVKSAELQGIKTVTEEAYQDRQPRQRLINAQQRASLDSALSDARNDGVWVSYEWVSISKEFETSLLQNEAEWWSINVWAKEREQDIKSFQAFVSRQEWRNRTLKEQAEVSKVLATTWTEKAIADEVQLLSDIWAEVMNANTKIVSEIALEISKSGITATEQRLREELLASWFSDADKIPFWQLQALYGKTKISHLFPQLEAAGISQDQLRHPSLSLEEITGKIQSETTLRANIISAWKRDKKITAVWDLFASAWARIWLRTSIIRDSTESLTWLSSADQNLTWLIRSNDDILAWDRNKPRRASEFAMSLNRSTPELLWQTALLFTPTRWVWAWTAIAAASGKALTRAVWPVRAAQFAANAKKGNVVVKSLDRIWNEAAKWSILEASFSDLSSTKWSIEDAQAATLWAVLWWVIDLAWPVRNLLTIWWALEGIDIVKAWTDDALKAIRDSWLYNETTELEILSKFNKLDTQVFRDANRIAKKIDWLDASVIRWETWEASQVAKQVFLDLVTAKQVDDAWNVVWDVINGTALTSNSVRDTVLAQSIVNSTDDATLFARSETLWNLWLFDEPTQQALTRIEQLANDNTVNFSEFLTRVTWFHFGETSTAYRWAKQAPVYEVRRSVAQVWPKWKPITTKEWLSQEELNKIIESPAAQQYNLAQRAPATNATIEAAEWARDFVGRTYAVQNLPAWISREWLPDDWFVKINFASVEENNIKVTWTPVSGPSSEIDNNVVSAFDEFINTQRAEEIATNWPWELLNFTKKWWKYFLNEISTLDWVGIKKMFLTPDEIADIAPNKQEFADIMGRVNNNQWRQVYDVESILRSDVYETIESTLSNVIC